MIKVIRTTSDHSEFRKLIKELDKSLWNSNYDNQAHYDKHNVIDFIDTVVVALNHDKGVGCGCFRSFTEDTIEVKRMFVREEYRGKGIASQLLQELENMAREKGFKYALLETGTRQHEALALYRKKGYVDIENFGPYVGLPDSVCLKKNIDFALAE